MTEPEKDSDLDEFDVGVVVYVRTRAVDRQDAEGRAERGVSEALMVQGRGAWPCQLPIGRDFSPITLAGTSYLSVAMQHLIVRPDSQAYRYAGMGQPKRKDEE